MEPVSAPAEEKDGKVVAKPIDDVKPPEHTAAAPAPADSDDAAPAATEDEKKPTDNPEASDDPAAKLEEDKKPEEPKKAPKPKQPRQPGVTLAIVATVVIVLGLGLLATYAYLRS
jgi:hypothetical protein